MTDRIPVAWVAFGIALCISLPAAAQPVPSAKATGAKKTSPEPLSAEERIRRATVPPPGKACPPDPAEVARAKVDARHARNLDFVLVSDQTVEAAEKIAHAEWARQRSDLKHESMLDWKAWVNAQHNEQVTWEALPPCDASAFKTPGTASNGKSPAAGGGFGNIIRHVIGPDSRKEQPNKACVCPPGAENCQGETATLGPRDLAQFMLGFPGRRVVPVRAADRELYASVRGELLPSGQGTELLLASASNVPVVCGVDMLVEREGKEFMRKALLFKGPGSKGDIVEEVVLGLEPNAYTDVLVINAACVPRYVWASGANRDIPR